MLNLVHLNDDMLIRCIENDFLYVSIRGFWLQSHM